MQQAEPFGRLEEKSVWLHGRNRAKNPALADGRKLPAALASLLEDPAGRARTIEIWFSLVGDTLYMLSGGGDTAQWVKNLQRAPRVEVRLGETRRAGTARVIDAPDEDARARRLLDGKYMGWSAGKRLSGWARASLPVAVDLDP